MSINHECSLDSRESSVLVQREGEREGEKFCSCTKREGEREVLFFYQERERERESRTLFSVKRDSFSQSVVTNSLFSPVLFCYKNIPVHCINERE